MKLEVIYFHGKIWGRLSIQMCHFSYQMRTIRTFFSFSHSFFSLVPPFSDYSKREERIGRKERFSTKLVKDGNFTLRKNGMMEIE